MCAGIIGGFSRQFPISNSQLPSRLAAAPWANALVGVGSWKLGVDAFTPPASPASRIPDHHQRHRRRLHDFEDRYERLLWLGRSAAAPCSRIAGAGAGSTAASATPLGRIL